MSKKQKTLFRNFLKGILKISICDNKNDKKKMILINKLALTDKINEKEKLK